MSDNNMKMCSSAGSTKRRAPTDNQSRKNARFWKKQAYLENKHADGKCKYERTGQFRPYQAPRQNRASTKHPSRFTRNKTLPPPSGTASTSSLSPKPWAATRCQSSSTSLAANKTGCLDKTKQPPSANSRPSSSSSSQKPTASQTSARIPSKYLAIDCEMVGAGPKGSISQLARCSIVSYDGDVVYDKFINPSMPVTDYRTRWSGIQRRDLVNAVPYREARNEILRLLTGKVVIGHAIHNDFKALGYTHPVAFTRDTSQISLLNLKAGFAVNECASLKRLTKAILNRDIQTGKKGHSSVEDARATMELYRLVEEEWERKLVSG